MIKQTDMHKHTRQGACFLSLPECFEFMGIPGTGDALAAAQPLEGAYAHGGVGNVMPRCLACFACMHACMRLV